jgi:hypothetical protein
VLAPVALAWLFRRRVEARLALWLVLASLALTLWQVRWGYFLGLIFALTLPLQMLAVRRQWIPWCLLVIGLWPVASWWESQLFPDDFEARRRVDITEEQEALRAIAEQQRTRNAGAFVAPWWLSPALTYWSNQPGVAGSSHESLSGTADSARIYLAPDANAALPILKQRRVQWVLSDVPERIVPTSARILGVPEPAQCLAYQLDRHDAPPSEFPLEPDPGVRLPAGRDFFRVWRITPQP